MNIFTSYFISGKENASIKEFPCKAKKFIRKLTVKNLAENLDSHTLTASGHTLCFCSYFQHDEDGENIGAFPM